MVANNEKGRSIDSFVPAVENTEPLTPSRPISRWHSCCFLSFVVIAVVAVTWGLGETGYLGNIWPSDGPWPSLEVRKI